MPEYIEREAALQEIRADMGRFGAGEDTKELLPGLYLAEGVVERAPAADVVPVVHGRYISTGYDEWYCDSGKCSNCGGDMLSGSKFCPNCGAKMKLEEQT